MFKILRLSESMIRNALHPSLCALAFLLVVVTTQANIVINEIHFDPIEKSDRTEFVEFFNDGPSSVDLSGWRVSGGIDYDFPPGTGIASGGYLVISEDPTRLQQLLGASSLGPFTGHLGNDNGDTVRLRNGSEQVIDEVAYGIMTPWPGDCVGEGSSMELIHPGLDNSLGGSWRASAFGEAQNISILPAQSPAWRYRKGTSEASSPTSAWRLLNFTENASWATGKASIGYGDSDDNTALGDMRYDYTSVFLRHPFQVSNSSLLSSGMKLSLYVDDGCIVWINGQEVARVHIGTGDKAYNATADNHEASWEEIEFAAGSLPLLSGSNIIAIQAFNQSSTSSDFSIDAKLDAVIDSGGPSPGTINHQYQSNAPPQARQISHSPEQAQSNENSLITAKVTDPDGVQSVTLSYQIVAPGSFLPAWIPLDRNTLMNSPLTELAPNPAFENAANWTQVTMLDDGQGADAIPGDNIFSATIPGQSMNRTLVRYRVTVQDTLGASVLLPYSDDPSLNFAYYVYNGLPDYQVSNSTAYGGSHSYSAADIAKVPVYQIITDYDDLMHAYAYSPAYSTWAISKSNLDARRKFNWECAFVFEGKVHDHVSYRLRQSNDRYAQDGKRSMRFRFRKGRYLQTHDYFGRDYPTKWRSMNVANGIRFTSSSNNIIIEDVNYHLFDLYNIAAPNTHMFHMRVVDSAEEAPSGSNGQYLGDFYGLFLALEDYDGRLQDSQELPDGNMYKLRDGFPDGYDIKKVQGRYSVTNVDDYNNIRNNLLPSKSESWLNEHVDYDRIYRYHSLIEALRGYDTGYFGYQNNSNKNQVWYFDPSNSTNSYGRCGLLPHDTDATWSAGYPGTWGNSQFKEAITLDGGKEPFLIPLRNHYREFRDLAWQPEVVLPLIEEHAAIARELSKADQDRWNGAPAEAGFNTLASMDARIAAMHSIAFEVDYRLTVDDASSDVIPNGRAGALDIFAAQGGDDTQIPNTPSLIYTGPANHPINGLTYQSSSFSDPQGAGTFQAMQWRIGEITNPSAPAYDPADPLKFEIQSTWELETDTFNSNVKIPTSAVKVGHSYRARVRMKDMSNRWSHWSAPAEFTVGDSDSAVNLAADLRVSEVMYHPAGGDLNAAAEFIELYNSGNETLDLEGVTFTSGISFTFPPYSLPTGSYVLIVRDPVAFTAVYPNAASLPIVGLFSGKISDGGELITLKSGANGTVISKFEYNDGFGWPHSADGAGHSLVPLDPQTSQHDGHLDYGRNWIAGYPLHGTPGAGEPTPRPVPPLLLNEFTAHTDYSGGAAWQTSNDWIEIFNPGSSTVTLDDHWYLSDDSDDLKKWSIPAQSLSGGSWHTFTEVDDFHTDPALGFGLNKAGESIFLSYLPGTADDRVVDSVRFKGQANGATQGRYPDGADYWMQTAPTPTAANQRLLENVLIDELMYHPSPDLPQYEFLEIHNSGNSPVTLSAQETMPWGENWAASWRMDGGIGFNFPSGYVMQAQDRIVLVSFDPLDTLLKNDFLNHYNVAEGSITLMGPFSGRLSNKGERVALEKPQPPDLQGDSGSWIIVDEIIYSDSPPWDDSTDGEGKALQRTAGSGHGNDPASWAAGLEPSPGRDAPKVAMTFPAPGARYVTPAAVMLQAAIETRFITGSPSIEFFINDLSVGTVYSEPFELTHNLPEATASYTLRCVLTDDNGSYDSAPQALSIYTQHPIVTLSESRLLNMLFSEQLTMDGSVDSNGLPPDMIHHSWQQEGPAYVWLGDYNSPTSTARFTTPGIYTLSLVTAFGGQSTVNQVEVEVLAANTANQIPYEEGFESYDVGSNLAGVKGWFGSFAEIINPASGRSAPNVPMLDATHQRALRLQDPLINRFENTSGLTDIWFDTLVECRLWNGDSPPAIIDNEQFAIHFNLQGHPMIWHKQSGGSDGWTEIPSVTLSNGQWTRLTAQADLNSPGNPGFRLWFDQTPVTNPMTFFAAAGTNQQPFTEVELHGASSIDDLVVDDYDVLNFRKLTTTVGPNGQVSPAGETLVPISQSVSVTATANPYYLADTIKLDSNTVWTGATAATTYEVGPMNSRHSVHAVFDAARAIHDVPHWWLNAANPDWTDNFDLYASGDFDHDGKATWQEYTAGTDPLQASDFLQLTISSQTENSCTLSWNSRPGREYRLLRSDSLAGDAEWQVIATATGDGNDLSWTDIYHSIHHFYKVEVNYAD